MVEHIKAPDVGAPDPELKNSPILEFESSEDENFDLDQETGICYFNNTRYAIGQYITSGSALLRCSERGVWIRVGPSYDI